MFPCFEPLQPSAIPPLEICTLSDPRDRSTNPSQLESGKLHESVVRRPDDAQLLENLEETEAERWERLMCIDRL